MHSDCCQTEEIPDSRKVERQGCRRTRILGKGLLKTGFHCPKGGSEALSLKTGLPLKTVTVAKNSDHLAHLTVEQGAGVLTQIPSENVFGVLQGPVSKTIVERTIRDSSLLIVGAYGFRNPEENVLGSTTTGIIRKVFTAVLIYRQLL